MKYIFIKGMHQHPFSDGSGIAFFDPKTTVVSSIDVDPDTLNKWFNNQETLTKEQKQALIQLQNDGIIEADREDDLD